MSNMIWKVLLPVAAILTATLAQTFKTCAESESCNFLRNKLPNPSEFEVPTWYNVNTSETSVTLDILKNQELVLRFTASFLADNTIRLQVTELYDTNRYFLDSALVGVPTPEDTPIHWIAQNAQNVTLVWGADHSLVIYSAPFSAEIYHRDDLVAIFNADGRLTFDHDGNNRAVGFDISFPLATFGYGLPLHADNLLIRQTGIGGEDPYRLYNVDVENYEVNSTYALSGAVPVLFAHGRTHTTGVFFHNAYDTWVDIDYSRGYLATHFMVEDGVFDAFIFLGPQPHDVYRQYTTLTGITPLPPIWSLGYHHLALPGESSEEVLDLVSSFDTFEIPLESVWITEQLKTFEWDPVLFPNPLQFLQTLDSVNKKAVLSVTPFLSANFTHEDYITAILSEFLVLGHWGTAYIGDSYMGRVCWWDFIFPSAISFFSELFAYDKFLDTTSTVAGFWNILNQPVALNEEENILPLDNRHYTGFYHKDVHNVYSHLANQATFMGLYERDLGEKRPFVLADSFFAGSQRYAAIHTGYSGGDWDHLAFSYRMCLSVSLAGVPFCGSNLGGFGDTIEEELLVRWYQAAVWLPLFRSSRRPTEISPEARVAIKAAIDLRYSLVDHIYTLFYEHERFQSPVIRPLFYQYPAQPDSYSVENGYMLSNDVLVYPISQSNQTSHIVYLPPGDTWYDIDTPLVYTGYGFTLVDVVPEKIPTFYRGGSIVLRRSGQPKTTSDLKGANFVMFVFVRQYGVSAGRIYLDDGESYKYRHNEHAYTLIEFVDDVITFAPVDPDANYPGEDLLVSSYVIYRPRSTRTMDNGTPVPVIPEVYHTTADGTPVKDIKINLNKSHSVRLR